MAIPIWNMFAQEHGLSKDGLISEEQKQGMYANGDKIFMERQHGQRYLARALFLDNDPLVFNQIRNKFDYDLIENTN